MGDSGLTRPMLPHKRNGLIRLNHKANALEDEMGTIIGVAEPDVSKFDFAFDTRCWKQVGI